MAERRRCAVVTGAAGGIGQATVRALAAGGYAVIATDREARPDGLRCLGYIQADIAETVMDPAAGARIFAEIRTFAVGGDLALLVNNAAVQILGGVEALTTADWQQTLQVNLMAPFAWTQALLPELVEAGGCVVNISSIHARLTKPGFLAYATSKAALSGMTRAMAVDLAGRVRVNAIEPAAIATPMLEAGFAGKPALRQALDTGHPVGRIGRPDEVGACVLWLASPEAAFVNGSCFALDGGIGGRLLDPD